MTAARRIAADAEDWTAVAGLNSALGYAEGRIQRPDFEAKYGLFRSRDTDKEAERRQEIALLSALQYRGHAERARQFLSERPEASIADFAEMCDGLAAEAAFLDEPPDRPGRYRIMRGRREFAVWLHRVMAERIDVEDPEAVVRGIVTSPAALDVLTSDEHGEALLAARQLQQRSRGLAELRRIAEDPAALEKELQEALRGQSWIFGGAFDGELEFRRLVEGDELDIPLLRPDGTLHVVELKRSMGLERGHLVTHHRNALVLVNEVHRAVSQVMNYLVGLDEHRAKIKEDLGIDTRRASATILIGHPALHPDIPEEEINEVLRIFNSHLARIEVRTYKDLIDSAERSLGLIRPH